MPFRCRAVFQLLICPQKSLATESRLAAELVKNVDADHAHTHKIAMTNNN